MLDEGAVAGRIVETGIVACQNPEAKECSMFAILRTSLLGLVLVALTAVFQAAESDQAKTGEPRPQIDVPRIARCRHGRRRSR